MESLNIEKVVAALPETLTKNTLYLVRTGTGFDFYVTNNSGTIVAYKVNGGLSNVTLDFLDAEVIADLKYNFPATLTNDSNGNPTQILETGIGTDSRKRQTDMTYSSNGNILTQEIRVKESDNTFQYGIRKTFSYSGDNMTGIATETLLS